MILQYLTLEIDNTVYAIDVFHIQEVLEYEEPLTIPCSSPLLKGIIRSRDTNIPVLNLRKKFNLEDHIPNKLTRTIVIEINDKKSNLTNLYGLICDKVIEVIEVDEKFLESVPKSKNFAGSDFISSIISIDENYILVLDVDKVFSEEEISDVKKSAKKHKSGSIK